MRDRPVDVSRNARGRFTDSIRRSMKRALTVAIPAARFLNYLGRLHLWRPARIGPTAAPSLHRERVNRLIVFGDGLTHS